MAIAGDPKVFGALVSHPKHPLLPSLSASKVQFGGFSTGGSKLRIAPGWRDMGPPQGNDIIRHKHYQCFGITSNKVSPTALNQDVEGLLLNAINMSFFERLGLAWKILFPNPAARRRSNANIAKQRLKMVLFSDRCAVSDEAKQMIVSNVIQALSEFVEIDSEDKVQLNVSTDPALGTMYSVTVPVRRVKPGYHDSDDDYRGKIASIEYKDTGETSGSVDVRFDFFVPGEQ